MSELKVDSVLNKAGTGLPTNIQEVTATAWANWSQIGTQTLRGSVNIASIIDLGVGRTQLTFLSLLSNLDYAVLCTGDGNADTSNNLKVDATVTKSIATVSVRHTGLSESDTDNASMMVIGGKV